MINLKLLTAGASQASACAVCFGGKASDIAGLVSGLTWGIIVLLAATFSAIGGLVAMIMRIERQRAAADAAAGL